MEDQELEGVEKWVDEMTEKRSATRLNALEHLISHSQKNPDCEKLHNLHFTIASNAQHMLKKSKAEEFKLVCNLIELISIAFDEPQDGEMEDSVPAIETIHQLKSYLIVSSDSFDSVACEHALRAASVLGIMNQTNPQDVLLTVETVASGHVTDEARRAALRAWGALATFSPNAHHLVKAPDSFMLRLLDHPDSETRVLAAEILCFIATLESRRSAQSMDANDDSGEVNTSQDGEEPTPDWVGEAVVKLEDLSHDNHSGGKDTFHRINAALEFLRDDELPDVKISIGNVAVEMSGWDDVLRLTFFRDVLKDGLVEHFKRNSAMHQIFNFQAKGLGEHVSGSKMVDLDRRSFRESRVISKMNSAKIKEARKKRENAKNQFMNEH